MHLVKSTIPALQASTRMVNKGKVKYMKMMLQVVLVVVAAVAVAAAAALHPQEVVELHNAQVVANLQVLLVILQVPLVKVHTQAVV